MSEQAQEAQAGPQPSSALDPSSQAQPAQAQSGQPQAQASSSDEQTFPIRLVKRPTGDTHWNVAKGVYELVTHAETGEPSQEYALLATIDGVDVTLQTFNAGGVETLVRAAQQSQQQSGQ